MSSPTKTRSCVLLVPRGHTLSVWEWTNLRSSTISSTLKLIGLALFVLYQNLTTPFLENLGVHIDNKHSFKAYVSAILKKVYAKIGAMSRLKRLVPPDVGLILYKCYIKPHLEYCSPLLLGINKTLVNKLEAANYYALKVLLNVGKDVDYNSILSIAGMNSLEFRIYEQSLLLLYKCIKGNGPSYISDFFKFRT